MQLPCFHNYINIFPGIQKSKKQLTSQDMVEYIISNTLKFLVVIIPGL